VAAAAIFVGDGVENGAAGLDLGEPIARRVCKLGRDAQVAAQHSGQQRIAAEPADTPARPHYDDRLKSGEPGSGADDPRVVRLRVASAADENVGALRLRLANEELHLTDLVAAKS
jgi:hypothetical protein